MKLALAQINTTVGALDQNRDRIAAAAVKAGDLGADLVVFPELAICGYPPEDLILKHHFVEDAQAALKKLAKNLPSDLVALVGSPAFASGPTNNAAAVLTQGEWKATYAKRLLPNYGVFDEKRLFAPGREGLVLSFRGWRIGLHICEDSWFTEAEAFTQYENAGLDVLINLSASPYHRGKVKERERTLEAAARRSGCPVAYCNLVGGQDDLVFDGTSLVLNASGQLVARAKAFEEDLLVVDIPAAASTRPSQPGGYRVLELDEPSPSPEASPTPTMARIEPLPPPLEEVYAALRLGVRDYVTKNRFAGVLIAISGGIDSALVAALAVDALGAERVSGITLPSRYSSSDTHGDAHELARRLGFHLYDLAIQPLFEAYLKDLSPIWEGREPDVAEENLQARIRGTLVMALSNKFGLLVLTTGNKSELATGYCTLYGDMVGGFAAIKDVPKTLVFDLCRWRNASGATPVIPPSIIERPPSAELRADQKDSDSLPPYDLLDPILERYVEWDWSAEKIVADGYDSATVERVLRLVDFSEYKRRQGAPGIKITPKAFGRDRRLPITNHYREIIHPAPPARDRRTAS